MAENEQSVSIVLNNVAGALVATIQAALTPDVLDQFKQALLIRLEKDNVHHLLFDFSGLELMDANEFKAIQKIINMASLMGVPSILVGFRSGIVASLVQHNLDILCMKTALNLEDAFNQIENK